MWKRGSCKELPSIWGIFISPRFQFLYASNVKYHQRRKHSTTTNNVPPNQISLMLTSNLNIIVVYDETQLAQALQLFSQFIVEENRNSWQIRFLVWFQYLDWLWHRKMRHNCCDFNSKFNWHHELNWLGLRQYICCVYQLIPKQSFSSFTALIMIEQGCAW